MFVHKLLLHPNRSHCGICSLLWKRPAILDGTLICAVLCRSQMIYFVLAVSVMGQTVQNGALLELTGEAAKVEFGRALTLIHNSMEDELVCSGKLRASDVVIEGTTTTVADLIEEVAKIKEDMTAVKQFVGMMTPSVRSTTGTTGVANLCGWHTGHKFLSARLE